jgi:hypothetical protein
MASVLAIGPKVCGSNPIRGLWTFKDDRSPQHTFFQRASKAVAPKAC